MSNGDEESVQSGDFTSELDGNFDGDLEEDDEEEHLDPRVQVELEKLNASTEVINKFREQLDEAKSAGRQAFNFMTQKMQELSQKLGKCIQKARPYYEARVELKNAQAELQQAAMLFEKGNASLKASKEMVRLTEEGLTQQGGKLDETWQEMLNYAVAKVAQCELDICQRKKEHAAKAKHYAEGEIKVKLLEKKFKSSINKSKPYYELRAQMNHFVEKEKFKVYVLEKSISEAKASYAEGLANLEGISEAIHMRRRLKDELQQRDSGCGTLSESVSIAGSFDMSEVIIMEDRPRNSTSSSSGDKHQQILDALHDMIYSKNDDREEDADGNRKSSSFPEVPSDLCPTPKITKLLDQQRPAKNAQSYPLLTALEKELTKLQLETPSPVIKPNNRKLLHAVPSVDSAVDSGSECELDALDDDLVGNLHFASADRSELVL